MTARQVRRWMIVAMLLLIPRAASAQAPSTEARRHYDAGIAAYQRGDFDRAIEELTRSREIEARPDQLYALGQAARRKGDCRRAIDFYQAYLREDISLEQQGAVRILIDRCTTELAKVPPPEPPPQIVAPAPPGDPLRPRLFRVGVGLLVPGLVLGITGGVLLGLSGSAVADARSAQTSAAWQDARDRAVVLQNTGAPFVAVGGALAVAGVAVLVARATRSPVRVGVVATPQQLFVGIDRRF